MVFSKNKRYFEGANRKYQLDFQNSGLHLSDGIIIFWSYKINENIAL